MPITLSRRRAAPRAVSAPAENIVVVDLTIEKEVKEEPTSDQESESNVPVRSSTFCSYQSDILVENKVDRSTKVALNERSETLSSD